MRRIMALGGFVALALVGSTCCAALCAGVASADPQPCWRAMPDPSNFSTTQIAVVDQSHGWAAGSDEFGPVFTTSDGGATWTGLGSLGFRSISDIAAVDKDTAWVVGERGPSEGWGAYVLHTHDGGTTWERFDFALGGLGPRQIWFADTSHGWVVVGKTMYATTDGGHTWTAGAGPDDVIIMHFLDRDRGWVLAHASIANQGTELWNTTDGGATWSQVGIPSYSYGYSSVCFVDDRHGFLSCETAFFATDDGGLTWSARTGLPGGGLATVRAASDAEHVWAAISDGRMFASEDGGQTWVTQGGYYGYLSVLPDLQIIGDQGWVAGSRFARTDTNGFSDLHPPVTTFSPPELINAPTVVALTATDVGTGVAAIWHSVDSMPWEEGGAVTVWSPSVAGSSEVRVAAVDEYGNWEEPKTFTVRYDFAGPTPFFNPVRADELDVWVNHDSYVRVGVTDDWRGAGVRDFEVSRDGGAWRRYDGEDVELVTRAAKDHRNDGVHTIGCRGWDQLGNAGPTVEHSLGMDTRRPTAAARYVAHATARGIGRLRFKLSDARPCSGVCSAVVTVTTTSNRKLGVLKPDVWFRTGRYVTLEFTCPLKAGKYKFVVRGTDGAGNLTVKPAWNYLVVGRAKGTVLRSAGDSVPFRAQGASQPVRLHAEVVSRH